MRDLHALGCFIRRADRGDIPGSRELDHRLHALRAGHRHRPPEPDSRSPHHDDFGSLDGLYIGARPSQGPGPD